LQAFDHKRARITHLIYDYLKEKNPDLVISVMPVVNSATIDATELLGIPFWVIPTDLDPVVFLHGIDTPTTPRFFFNVPYKMPELYDHLASSNIPEGQITYVGFPVRKQFLQTYDKTLIKHQYAIPEQVPVIMLMMGGLGLEDTVHFAHELAKVTTPAHCLLCIGKNENLRIRLERVLDKASSISYSIIGFTPDIAPLMAVSDLLITKSGGATINEALYLGVPMIIDGSSTAPHWEYYNRSFIANTGCGILLKKIKKLSGIVEQILGDPAMLAEMKDAIQHIPKLDPSEAVRAQVALLLGQQKA
jgi:processive 1,2-diacylglycerol beta-glucosyltransferase